MSISNIVINASGKGSKDIVADIIVKNILSENPLASKLNVSAIRNFAHKLLDYNNPVENPYYDVAVKRAECCAIPMHGSDKLIITIDKETRKVSKVCPECNFTANASDPLCTNCNHVYENYQMEASAIAEALRKCNSESEVKMEGSKRGSNLVLQDDVEGIKLTERDIDKYMTNIDKFIPKSR